MATTATDTAVMFVGDIGTAIQVELTDKIDGAPIDLNDATVLIIRCKKPDGSFGQWDAVVSADGDNIAEFVTTQETDIDQSGGWKRQAYVEITGWKGHSTVISWNVKAALK